MPMSSMEIQEWNVFGLTGSLLNSSMSLMIVWREYLVEIYRHGINPLVSSSLVMGGGILGPGFAVIGAAIPGLGLGFSVNLNLEVLVMFGQHVFHCVPQIPQIFFGQYKRMEYDQNVRRALLA